MCTFVHTCKWLYHAELADWSSVRNSKNGWRESTRNSEVKHTLCKYKAGPGRSRH